MNSRKAAAKRRIIVTRTDLRPYAARIGFQVIDPQAIGELESVTLLLPTGQIATVQPARKTSWDSGKRYEATLEGFRNAAQAHNSGKQFVQSLLWLAISLNFGLRVQPVIVVNRNPPQGISAWGEGTQGFPSSVVVSQLLESLQGRHIAKKLLLSIELYCSALLETNDPTRFISVVSALEPLAAQKHLGPWCVPLCKAPPWST